MIGASCIALLAGTTLLILPTGAVTLSWTHSVERTSWEEDYTASTEGLLLTEARIEAIGAGMEPPASAIREGRWWRYRPSLPPLPSIDLANSAFMGGYSICWDADCRRLGSMVPGNEPVAIKASRCAGEGAGPPPAATP